MAESQRSRAYVWLALSSALIVLLASGVAISRLGDRGSPPTVASAPEHRSPAVGEADSGPAPGSGPATSGAPAVGSATGVASGTAGDGTTAAPVTADGSGRAGGQSGAGSASASTSAAGQRAPGASGSEASDSRNPDTRYGAGSASQAGGSQADGSQAGGSQGNGSQGGGSQGGGPDKAPAPSQERPEKMPLIGAHVSAGEGANGGVVGVGFDSATPDADVTVGTTPVIGNHPPSQGTGINFGGRFFHPPPSIPVLPG